jgi:CubicO group peptidase (beta-lactamase class C family)
LFCGDQGAVLLPVGADRPLFQPRRTRFRRPRTALAWPEGDGPAEQDTRFAAAADAAFSDDPDTGTQAFLVAHRGRLLFERYAEGISPDTPLESWSIGKSLTATLVAVAVRQGLVSLDASLALREWRDADDPRRGITVEHALRMSGGLGFSAPWASDYDPTTDGAPDHGFIYSGAVDSRALIASRAQRHVPGVFGAYKNADTLALIAALEDRVLGDFLRWPYEALLEPIGADTIVLETDAHGRFVPSGFVYGGARDWARLAQLFLNAGVWNGSQIADALVLGACQCPSSAWRGQYWMAQPPQGFEDAIYGGHVWLNRHAPQDRWPLPSSTFFFMGVGGQYVFVVPSLELIIVRMGDVRKTVESGAGRGHVPKALALVVAALEMRT